MRCGGSLKEDVVARREDVIGSCLMNLFFI